MFKEEEIVDDIHKEIAEIVNFQKDSIGDHFTKIIE
jgi:hypothetical protein